jgi:ABC-type lipoprotein export system ATPase subunit
MLSIKNITRSYTQRGVVLDNLSLEIAEGEAIAVTGPSGSGKTTLLNLIGLLDQPEKGEIIFRGEPLSKYSTDEASDYRNRNIGFVFQQHLLMPYLTIEENVKLPLYAGKLSQAEFSERCSDAEILMKKTGILPLASRFPSQVSGGEAQRAALVRALVNKPSLLLADEPTGSLDEKNAMVLGDLLMDLNSATGVTIILVTHSQAIASKLKRVFSLDNGKLIATR